MPFWLIIAATLALPPQSSQPVSRQSRAFELLVKAKPAVDWNSKSGIEADIDCDGCPDEAFLGSDASAIYVAVVRGGNDSVVVLRFPSNSKSQAQDAVCGRNVNLSTERIDSGKPGVPGCLGLSLDDGLCDPFNIYWDKSSGQLDWWRN